MDGVIINDEIYKIVESDKRIECDNCALKDTVCVVCDSNGLEICLAELLIGPEHPKVHHFVKLNNKNKK